MKIHHVKKGEYLGLIAKQYNTTIQQIMKDNAHLIKDPNVIFEGMQLRITDGKTTTKNYSAIGKQVEKVINDVMNLDSFKELLLLL